MKFAIQINAAPYQNSTGLTAYRFIEAALAQKHDILRVFFYRDGIYHALRYAVPPTDEINLTARWSALAKEFGIDLAVCISAAQRRGLLSVDEAQRLSKQDNDLADGFRITGLGLWLEAIIMADRFLVFG
jgi:tRNA 2-thiouridine synthesizing protein D